MEMNVAKVNSVLFIVCFTLGAATVDQFAKPAYQYRYETEDVMKTAATGVPVHGYRVVEGGYYPESNFHDRGGRYLDTGSFGRFGSGFSPNYINGQRFIGGGNTRFTQPISSGVGNSGFRSSQQYVPLQHGGQHVDKNSYNDEKKSHNGEVYEKSNGEKEEVKKHDEEGYTHGKVALKKDNADKGFYSSEEGDKKHIKDGKHFVEDKHLNKEEKLEDAKKLKKGHKKGHVTKGFRTTHHKDESGKTETFFDEESDEGDNYSFDGKSGNYGENSQSAVKGEHENGKFNAGQRRSEGHYDDEHVVDKGNQDKGEYGKKVYSSGGEIFGVNKGIDEHSLLGQQEASRMFKHYPYQHGGHVPFYSHF